MPNMSPGSYDLATQTTSNAIKAKTDNLPAAPANEVTGTAIKAKTDVLAFYTNTVKSVVPRRYLVVAGATVLAQRLAEYLYPATGRVMVPIRMVNLGPDTNVVSITFDWKTNTGGSNFDAAIFQNGVQVGTTRSTTNAAYATAPSEDITIANGDLLEIQLMGTSAVAGSVKNVYIKGTATEFLLDGGSD